WRGQYIFIGEAVARETVGLAEQDLGGYLVRFANRELGLIDKTGRFHSIAPPRARTRCQSTQVDQK
ncbi:MAG: hypothetical protein RJQ21_15645, partial [Rhodospirillales bacterium]